MVDEARGAVVLFHLFTAWCPPCRAEFPDLIELEKRYRGQKFVVIAVSLDNAGGAAELDQFIGEMRPGFPTYRVADDDRAALNSALNRVAPSFTGAIPYSAYYDRAGRKVTEMTGREPREAHEELIKSLL